MREFDEFGREVITFEVDERGIICVFCHAEEPDPGRVHLGWTMRTDGNGNLTGAKCPECNAKAGRVKPKCE